MSEIIFQALFAGMKKRPDKMSGGQKYDVSAARIICELKKCHEKGGRLHSTFVVPYIFMRICSFDTSQIACICFC